MCIGFGLTFNVIAGDAAKRLPDEGAAGDGMRQTLNLNFSPENREKLRRALNDYSRAVDPDHDQIEERRRAMQASIQERFLEADTDRDGKIDRQEATEKLPQIARHFNGVDTNQDGFISLEELQAAQARILERRRVAETTSEPQSVQEVESPPAGKRKNKQFTSSPSKSAL